MKVKCGSCRRTVGNLDRESGYLRQGVKMDVRPEVDPPGSADNPFRYSRPEVEVSVAGEAHNLACTCGAQYAWTATEAQGIEDRADVWLGEEMGERVV